MAVLFANFGSSTLAAAITNVALVIAVRTGDGKKFPLPLAGDYFMVVVEDADGNTEIMKCTGRNNDLLTVVRAQEGTVKDDFPTGARIENRLTAGVLTGLAYAGAINPTGDVVMQDSGLAFRGTYYEGFNPDAAARLVNRIAIPFIGRPFIGPSSAVPVERILTTSDVPIGVILLWSGYVSNIPARWRLCDGKTSFGIEAPDLRGLFVRGAGASGDEPDGAPSWIVHRKKTSQSARTEPIPNHNHSSSTGDHKLKDDEIAGHRHSVTISTTLESGEEIDQRPMLRVYEYPLYAVRQPTSDPNYRPINAYEPGGPGGEVGGGLQGGGGTSTAKTTGRTTYAGGSSTTEDTEADGHSHAISNDGGHSNGLLIEDVSPAFYSLAYIIKVT